MMKLKLQRKRKKRARGMAVDTDIIGGWMLPCAFGWFCCGWSMMMMRGSFSICALGATAGTHWLPR